MSLPIIEDEFEDVLGKAMRGMGLGASELAARSGLDLEDCEGLIAGRFDARAARLTAEALNLNASCLIELATEPKGPEVDFPDGIQLHNAPFPVSGYEAMTVNSYSILPPEQPDDGMLIDAGTGFESVLNGEDHAAGIRWRLFLTHTHPDHVVRFSELSQKIEVAYAPVDEPYMDALSIRSGDTFKLGPWQLRAIETPGHSPSGMSYLLEGSTIPVVFVGDALFCYSIGKVNADYEAALSVIRKNILSLPGETILCPGHGPPTTVAFERAHNPFFATNIV